METKYNKKLDNEMQIYSRLSSIEECVNVARGYINKEYEVYDVNELVATLAGVTEDIDEIEELISEIIEEYEKEIMELKYEQL